MLFGQNPSNVDRMGKIRLAGMTKLPFMHLAAKIIGRADQSFICLGVVGANEVDKICQQGSLAPTVIARA